MSPTGIINENWVKYWHVFCWNLISFNKALVSCEKLLAAEHGEVEYFITEQTSSPNPSLISTEYMWKFKKLRIEKSENRPLRIYMTCKTFTCQKLWSPRMWENPKSNQKSHFCESPENPIKRIKVIVHMKLQRSLTTSSFLNAVVLLSSLLATKITRLKSAWSAFVYLFTQQHRTIPFEIKSAQNRPAQLPVTVWSLWERERGEKKWGRRQGSMRLGKEGSQALRDPIVDN